MKRIVPGTFVAVVALMLSQVSLANGGPASIHVFCSNFFDVSIDEGLFSSGEFCYQIKVSCDGDVSGGFLWGEVDPEGNVHGHMESVAGSPQPVGPHIPSCQHWFDHWQNGEFENVCEYEGYGKFKLKAKLVPLRRCDLD